MNFRGAYGRGFGNSDPGGISLTGNNDDEFEKTRPNEANPTEYAHVRFRSKCEAIFARNLDLGGFWWEYEPIYWRTSRGWLPDFEVFWQAPFHRIGKGLIEYKPCEVTQSYRDNLAKKFLSFQDNASRHFLVCGSPFNDCRQVWILGNGEWELKNNHEVSSVSGLFFSHLDEASHYRFDLEHRP